MAQDCNSLSMALSWVPFLRSSLVTSRWPLAWFSLALLDCAAKAVATHWPFFKIIDVTELLQGAVGLDRVHGLAGLVAVWVFTALGQRQIDGHG